MNAVKALISDHQQNHSGVVLTVEGLTSFYLYRYPPNKYTSHV